MSLKATMALHVVADYQDSPDDWYQVGGLVSWHAATWGPDFGKWSDGKDRLSFWTWMYHWAAQVKDLQVWGWDMWKAWCVLDGTKEISDGRIVLDIRQDCFIADNPPTIITFRVDKHKVTLADLGNLGIGKDDFGVSNDRGTLPAAKMAVQAFRKLCKEQAIQPKLTAAAQAWNMWSSGGEWSMERQSPVAEQSPPIAIALEEAAYYGGRGGCRRLGDIEERLWQLDVSAMYTSIAKTALFPVKYLGSWKQGEGRRNKDSLLMIADVTLKTPHALYPARESVRVNGLRIPDSGAYGERIIYPVGTFRTALCGPELAVAEAHGHIQAWHEIQYYEGAPLMARWATYALKVRHDLIQKKHPLARCWKRIINSLPGKWCQHNIGWRDCPSLDGPPSQWGQEYGRSPEGVMTMYRTIAGKCQYRDTVELAEHACPAVAAFWTSYGRVMLMGLIELLGPDLTYHYMTDSIITNDEGVAMLRESPGISLDARPGMLRITGVSDYSRFLGINKYFFDAHWVYAGLMPGDEGWEEMGLHQQLWHGKVGAPAQSSPVAKFDDYKHGTVTADGIVRPFVIGET